MNYTTKQRDAVEQVLASSARPLTAQEIWELARKKKSGLGIATVYRALKTLTKGSKAVLVEIPGSAPHYEWQRGRHHHHFLCESCQRVFELEGCVHQVVDLAPKKFKVKRHEIILYGSCEGCAQK
ncbi:MAG: transcriptional repressor [Blastochloris sp.]|nr:transcriptional repressor [Blastochloris sp.]